VEEAKYDEDAAPASLQPEPEPEPEKEKEKEEAAPPISSIADKVNSQGNNFLGMARSLLAPVIQPRKAAHDAKIVEMNDEQDPRVVVPNTVIFKTWLVENSGSADWPKGTKLVFVRGDELALQEEFAVTAAKVDSVVEVTAAIMSPPELGNYSCVFQLAKPNRTVFGQRMHVSLEVRDEGSPSPASPASAFPAALSSEPLKATPELVTPPANLSVAIPVAPAAAAQKQEQEKYHEHKVLLQSMGFAGEHVHALLEEHKGDLRLTINSLLNNA